MAAKPDATEGATPLLRADATDDVLDDNGKAEQLAAEPKAQVPVIIEGVFHGMSGEDD